MNFDVLIIGGGVAGMSCALVLGSARSKPYAKDKKIGIVMHQKTSALDGAMFNNVLGIAPGTTGKEILLKGRQQLADTYPHVVQIEKEKVLRDRKSNLSVPKSSKKIRPPTASVLSQHAESSENCDPNASVLSEVGF